MENANVSQWVSDIIKNYTTDVGLSIPLEQDGVGDNVQQQIRIAANDLVQQAEYRGVTLDDLSCMIAQLSNAIGQNNAMLLENVTQIMKKNEIANRNKKPKRLGEKLMASPNDYLSIVYQYDNGATQCYPLTKSVSGDYVVFTLDFNGHEECEKFGILFRGENKFVVGSKKRLRGDYLYECFVKSGIRFNTEIPKANVVRVLHEFFSPIIENTQDRYIVAPFAGWNRGRFCDSDNFAWQKTSEFPDLPVFHKHFERVGITNQMVKVYFSYLRQIVSVQDRVLVMIIPFIGCMASIINEAWHEIPFFVNFVMMNGFDWSPLCKLMKIFNRSDLQPNTLDITAKELVEILENANDEVLIFDAMYANEDSCYIKNKLRDNTVKIGNILTGKRGKNKGRKSLGYGLAVFFSMRAYQQKNCLNVYIDDDFFEDNGSAIEFDFLKAMEGVMTEFCSFVEKNYANILKKIRKRRDEKEERKLILEIMEDVLFAFWSEQEIHLREMLSLPENFRFPDIIQEERDGEELLCQFITGVRRNIVRFYAKDRGRTADYKMEGVYYDEKMVDFSPYVFRCILEWSGLSSYRHELLLELEKNSAIKKGKDGFLVKRTIGGERHKVYEISRELFNDIGKEEIIDLAKED